MMIIYYSRLFSSALCKNKIYNIQESKCVRLTQKLADFFLFVRNENLGFCLQVVLSQIVHLILKMFK